MILLLLIGISVFFIGANNGNIGRLVTILFAIIAAIIVGISALLFFIIRYYKKQEKIKQAAIVVDGYTKKDVDQIISDAKNKINKINKYSYTSISSISEKTSEITKISYDIINVIRKDPKNIKKIRKFLNYYLDATLNILEKNRLLESNEDVKEEHKDILNKVDGILNDLIKCFMHEYTKLYAEDALELDVEIEVLKTTINREIDV